MSRERQGMATLRDSYVSPQEYLALERTADFKSEYVDGIIYQMSGASIPHNLIAANLLGSLWTPLRDGSCRVFGSDLKIRTPNGKRYFYPDLSVICGPPQIADDKKDVVLNPKLIIEVLSESTAGYDRGTKFLAYQAIPSLEEYVLVWQDRFLVESYRRQGQEAWLYTKAEGQQATLELPSIGVSVSLAEIYRNAEVNAESGL